MQTSVPWNTFLNKVLFIVKKLYSKQLHFNTEPEGINPNSLQF